MIDWGEGIITSSFWRIPRQDEHTPILFLWWENVGKRGTTTVIMAPVVVVVATREWRKCEGGCQAKTTAASCAEEVKLLYVRYISSTSRTLTAEQSLIAPTAGAQDVSDGQPRSMYVSEEKTWPNFCGSFDIYRRPNPPLDRFLFVLTLSNSGLRCRNVRCVETVEIPPFPNATPVPHWEKGVRVTVLCYRDW